MRIGERLAGQRMQLVRCDTVRPTSKVEAIGCFPRYISCAHARATQPMNYRDTERCRN